MLVFSLRFFYFLGFHEPLFHPPFHSD
jgi:hypothetical protein